jgi:hypothetical protein
MCICIYIYVYVYIQRFTFETIQILYPDLMSKVIQISKYLCIAPLAKNTKIFIKC